MWARVVEVMLACWLAASPFIFRHASGARDLWVTDFGSATIVATLALLSFAPILRRAHLGHFLVAAWLVGSGYLGGEAPAHQNHVVLGILLAMFAIVPSHASSPPSGWRGRGKRPPEPPIDIYTGPPPRRYHVPPQGPRIEPP